MVIVLCLVFVPFQTIHASTLVSNPVSNPVEVEQSRAVSPAPVYVTETMRYKTSQHALPPGKLHVSRVINGHRYSGFLTRFSYANTGEYWLTTYKGYIYAE